MKKLALLIALLLTALLAAVGLHPEVLEGYKSGMFDKDLNTGKTFVSEKVTSPLLAAIKGGPDKGMQSGGLTPEEIAAMEGDGTDTPGTDPAITPPKDDPNGEKPENPPEDPPKAGTDEPEPATPDPKKPTPDKPEAGTDKPASGADKPEAGADKPESGADKPKAGTKKPESGADKPEAETKKPEAGPKKPKGGTNKPKGGTKKPKGGTKKPDDNGKTPVVETPAPDGDPITYVYDEFTAAGGVEFSGYSGVKSQNCWFNDISGSFDMPKGSPQGGKLNVVIATEELDCKDAKFTRVCLGYYLEIDDYPEATFVSSSIKPTEGENTYRVVGKLSIKDNSKPVAFNATIVQDEDDETATLSAEFKLNRNDYGLDYNGVAGYAISDEFSLKLELTGETE